MEQEWSVRAYQEGDEDRIFELWKAMHPEREYDREKWLRWWHWMYQDNPAGNGRIWLAEYDGKIVGQYAIVPVELKMGGEAILCSQSLDTMTHPNYRHQKIFETLARKVYHEAEEDGIFTIYGFPNQFSYPGFIKKLAWFDISTLRLLIKPLNWRNAIKLRIKSKFVQKIFAMGASLVFNKVFFRGQKSPSVEGLSINQITSFDDRINDLWAKASSQYQIMVVRNRDYLNWRYGAPDVDYSMFVAEKVDEIHGYLVLEHKIQKGVKVTWIFDMVAQSEEVMHCLVSKGVEDSQQENADLILYPLIANKSYHWVLKRNGFISLPFIKMGCFCAYSNSPSIAKDFLKNPENWLVQFGDSDAI